MAKRSLPISAPPSSGSAELVVNQHHFQRVIIEGLLRATVSIDISTADFKAMLVPLPKRRKALSIVQILRQMAQQGIEIRLLHAGTPSGPALLELRQELPPNLIIRRCPRLHAKAVVIDAREMYLGSANLTGAGLGAKAEHRRNFEWGIWTHSPSLIEPILEEFNQLWEGVACKKCQRHDICPVPLEEPQLD